MDRQKKDLRSSPGGSGKKRKWTRKVVFYQEGPGQWEGAEQKDNREKGEGHTVEARPRGWKILQARGPKSKEGGKKGDREGDGRYSVSTD